ncbi:MAG: GNAT family N-acetyltransferase [Synergistaceae bacterium]|nr:GNAT family N-acetyltransferase [Synergistaceae bacterium]
MLLADIRFCGKEDASQVLEVDRTSPYPWPERVVSRDLLAADSGLSYLGAFAPRAPVPRALASIQDKLLAYAVLASENGNGLLMNVVVLPEYRRRGIGTQLVVAAAECAAALSFSELALRVRLSNLAAAELYRNLGFVSVRTQDRYYSNGDAARRMSLKLPLVFSGERARR